MSWLILFYFICFCLLWQWNWKMLIIKIIKMFVYFVINKKMITDLNISHRKMSEFISIQLFPFTLVIKLQSFDFEIQWNISIFLIENHVTFEYVPWKNAWFCFVSNVWVNFSHKTKKFPFWKSLKYLTIFYHKKTKMLYLNTSCQTVSHWA